MPCRCEYIDCEVQRVHHPQVKMYRFPIKNRERLEKWKTNCGNIRILNLEPEKLRNKYICQLHFTPGSFVNATKHRLTVNSVPILYTTLTSKSVENEYNINNASMPSPTIKQEISEESINIPQEGHINTDLPGQMIKQENEYSPESSTSPKHSLEPECFVSTSKSNAEDNFENAFQEDDQHEVFGKFVASELRSGKSENLQKKIKLMIVKILMETNE